MSLGKEERSRRGGGRAGATEGEKPVSGVEMAGANETPKKEHETRGKKIRKGKKGSSKNRSRRKGRKEQRRKKEGEK